MVSFSNLRNRVAAVRMIAVRSLVRSRKRSAITVVTLAFGVSSAIILNALARGIGEDLVNNAITTETGHLQVHEPNYRDQPSSKYSFRYPEEILNRWCAGWSAKCVARVRLPAIVMSDREAAAVQVFGVVPEDELKASFLGNAPIKGSFFPSSSSDGIVIGEQLAKDLQTQLGKRIVLMTHGEGGEIASRGFRVVGIFSAPLSMVEKSLVYVSLETAQDFFRMMNTISEISVILPTSEPMVAAHASLREALPDLEVVDWQTLQPLTAAVYHLEDGFVSVWVALVIMAISFGLINTLIVTINERANELKLLHVVGVPRWVIVGQFVFEGALLAAIGVLVGLLFSGLGAAALFYGLDISIFAEGASFARLSRVIYPEWKVSDILLVTGACLLLAILTSLVIARSEYRRGVRIKQ